MYSIVQYRVLLEKLMVTQLVNNFVLSYITVFMNVHHWTPILNQLIIFFTFTPCFSKIHFNIVLWSTTGSPKWSSFVYTSDSSWVLHVPSVSSLVLITLKLFYILCFITKISLNASMFCSVAYTDNWFKKMIIMHCHWYPLYSFSMWSIDMVQCLHNPVFLITLYYVKALIWSGTTTLLSSMKLKLIFTW
jgi:hypothetical protein